MDDITKTFLNKCSQAKESLDTSELNGNGESYSAPSMTKLEVEEIFAVGGESTTVAAVSIGVSAVSA
ncbi:MAG: hypothetical protein NTW08_00235 [Gammaproteobacteria bacterium]|nr:hypothetical protein [Gammaproteobacteria bacterium]